jgi:hypothetical protein
VSALADEIDENGKTFAERWPREIDENRGKLSGDRNLVDSYRRITGVQALKTGIIEPLYGADATSFYAEAQNDALTSHVLASIGAWRPALQALRSCIENVLNAHFYADHPVELRLWSTTDFRLGFSELHAYFTKHPDLVGTGEFNGLDVLKGEYGTLSKAVHASAPSFRMTDEAAKLLLWSDSPQRLSMWATRERRVIEGVCLLTIALHRHRLSGAALPNVRESLSFAVSPAKRASLAQAHVHIAAPA